MREFVDKDKFWIDLQVQTPLSVAIRRNAVTEQEIVKPYFEKLKEQIYAQIDGGCHANSYDSGWDDALSEVLDMIDNILSEQEKAK
jgi:hypothetical protein